MYLSRHDEIAALAAPNPPSSKPVPTLGKLGFDAELMTLRGADNESKSNPVPTWANLDLSLLIPSPPAKPPSKNTQKRSTSKRKARKKRRKR